MDVRMHIIVYISRMSYGHNAVVQVSREGKGSWESAEGLHPFRATFRRCLLQPGLSLCWSGDPSTDSQPDEVKDGSLETSCVVLCSCNPAILGTFPQKRFFEAKEVYLQGIEKCPENSDLHNNYGVFLVDTGETTLVVIGDASFIIFSFNQSLRCILLSLYLLSIIFYYY